MRCSSSPEPTMRLALLPMTPSLGFPLPSESRHLEASTRRFDVNQAPSSGASAWGAYATAADDEQEDAGAAVSSSLSDEEDDGSACKMLRLSKEQAAFLEESFKEQSTLNPPQRRHCRQHP